MEKGLSPTSARSWCETRATGVELRSKFKDNRSSEPESTTRLEIPCRLLRHTSGATG